MYAIVLYLGGRGGTVLGFRAGVIAAQGWRGLEENTSEKLSDRAAAHSRDANMKSISLDTRSRQVVCLWLHLAKLKVIFHH